MNFFIDYTNLELIEMMFLLTFLHYIKSNIPELGRMRLTTGEMLHFS